MSIPVGDWLLAINGHAMWEILRLSPGPSCRITFQIGLAPPRRLAHKTLADQIPPSFVGSILHMTHGLAAQIHINPYERCSSPLIPHIASVPSLHVVHVQSPLSVAQPKIQIVLPSLMDTSPSKAGQIHHFYNVVDASDHPINQPKSYVILIFHHPQWRHNLFNRPWLDRNNVLLGLPHELRAVLSISRAEDPRTKQQYPVSQLDAIRNKALGPWKKIHRWLEIWPSNMGSWHNLCIRNWDWSRTKW